MQISTRSLVGRLRDGGTRSAAWAVGGYILLVMLAWVLDRHSLGLAWDAYLFSWGFFAGALPLLALYGLLLAVMNRTGLSVLLGVAALAGLFVANAKKLEYLHTTVVPADYYFLKDIDASSLGLFRHYVDVPVLVAILVAVVLLLALSLRYEMPTFRGRAVPRVLVLLASCAFGWVILTGGRVVDRIYDEQALRISYSPLMSELHAGLISSLIYESAANRRAMDVVADPVAVAQVVTAERARFPKESTPGMPANAELPDIVVVQSESFFDPSVMQDVVTTDLLPNLHRAQREAGASSMSVPTFGGGTLRTEFEVLTGIPLEAYPDLQFPYLQIAKTRIASVATVLADAGYSTTAIHPNSGSFWNRRAAFKSLGFQNFLTIKSFPESAYRDGFYISDHSMTSKVIESLENSKDPAFVFAISIETHGPYRHGVVKEAAERDALPVPASWPASAADEFRTYSYHIRHADSELGRLWDYLKQRKRPFILVFYGDHLPGFEFVYSAGKFQNGMTAYQQRVPWVLLRSGETSSPRPPEHIYSWMLADEILRHAGIPEPNYMRFAGNVGRMLNTEDGAAADQTHAGLQSAARMRMAGQFDAFYRSHAGAN